MFYKNDKMANYKQSGSASATLSDYITLSVTSGVRITANGSWYRFGYRQEKSGKNTSPGIELVILLPELLPRSSQSRNLVVDQFAGVYSAAVACFAVPRHGVFAECEPDLKCFRSTKRVWLR